MIASARRGGHGGELDASERAIAVASGPSGAPGTVYPWLFLRLKRFAVPRPSYEYLLFWWRAEEYSSVWLTVSSGGKSANWHRSCALLVTCL